MTIENNTIRIIVSEFQDIKNVVFSDDFESPTDNFLKEGFIPLMDFKLEIGFNHDRGVEIITKD